MDAIPIRSVSSGQADYGSDQPSLHSTEDDGVVSREDLGVTPPMSSYLELTGLPYAADFFGVKDFMNDSDFFTAQEMARYLDAFVIQRIADINLQNTTESFDEIMEKIADQIGEYQNEDPMNKLLRFYTAANAMTRLESAKIEPVLNAINLEPDEYQTLHGNRSV